MSGILSDRNPSDQSLKTLFTEKFQFVDPEIQLDRYDYFSQILLLNPDHPGKSLRAGSFLELLMLAIDDPDQGMDLNLPDSADPKNERKFMGGSDGPASQGFRHMYFGGWRWSRPIASFQIPTRAIGQAPDRIELLANESKKLIQSGDLLWGLRILAWSMHYAQDLTQPFHSVQVPILKMVTWKSLLQWPPNAGFEALVKDTTRTIGNYHRAFEIYVRTDLEKKENSVFKDCLTEKAATLLYATPQDLAMGLVQLSEDRAQALGQATYDYFGKTLMNPEVDLVKNPGKFEIPTGPQAEKSRKKLNELTCESLKLAKSSSLWLLAWAFHR